MRVGFFVAYRPLQASPTADLNRISRVAGRDTQGCRAWRTDELRSPHGRILNGAEPGESPVMLPTRFELVINDRTAKALRIAVPRRLGADEIID
jgi:hypothetical protein